ncbi:MAG TPA: ribonuclease E activity regulator RraA [Candidatus Limnocylindrales bacterium]|nr:ribonuclease E activity regulator RraA [Candidatus Limnocylindrales bacterium]
MTADDTAADGAGLVPFIGTADLADELGDTVESCDLQFRSFGRRVRVRGPVRTIRCRDDNVLLRDLLETPGEGGIVVVDGGGSLHTALIGDLIAGIGARNGWAGVIVNGAVRDVTALASVDLAIKALGSNPRRSAKLGAGERDVPVSFGGVTFRPGDIVVSDEDGIVVLPVR